MALRSMQSNPQRRAQDGIAPMENPCLDDRTRPDPHEINLA